MQEAILAVAVLFQKFDFRLKDPNYKITWKQTLTLRPRDLFMYAKLRPGIDPLSLQRDLFLGSENGSRQSFLPTNINGKAIHSDQERDLVPMSIFYGSNTGTCESLASRLAMTALQHGFKGTVKPLDEAKDNIPKDRPVVVITSTMYEGQPPGKYPLTNRQSAAEFLGLTYNPDNSGKFVEWLEDGKDVSLSGIHYAVFGCGSSRQFPVFRERTVRC